MSKALLETLKTSKDKLKIQITKEKMTNKYKIWDKRTATSPSVRHLGHYHALFKPFKFENSCKQHCLEEMREDIIEVHYIMLNITAIHSHVYNRWKNILTCMIKKDAGSAKIHRLQVIHLYKCDLNFFLGLFLREQDQHCKNTKMINKGLNT